ncbi:hypothetical protein [Methylobacterium sp. PvR107]|uniref:hypothetical protein n=1 Tax=Methylobacterium sp. PvR107 TaxID=2806597 RepID=UPI001AE2CE9A|nr:hypothetical protein [Methylobacterium sp. PvR107]MBP1180909.1 hypothetical protein [Methylobacterium sp. PvR107]
MADQLTQEAAFSIEHASINHHVNADSAATSASLIAEADKLWSDLLAMQENQPEQRADCAKRLIGTIYELHRNISPHRDLYRVFLNERGVEASKSLNPYHATARAVMERNGAKKVRSLCTHYAQACHVLDGAAVKPGAAVQWLNEPFDTGTGGRSLTGLGKTKHLWSLTPQGKKQRQDKRSKMLSNAANFLTNTVESGKGRLDEAMFAVDDTAIAEGARAVALVEIADGSVTVLNVLTTDLVKAAAAVRVCQKPTGKEAHRAK